MPNVYHKHVSEITHKLRDSGMNKEVINVSPTLLEANVIKQFLVDNKSRFILDHLTLYKMTHPLIVAVLLLYTSCLAYHLLIKSQMFYTAKCLLVLINKNYVFPC